MIGLAVQPGCVCASITSAALTAGKPPAAGVMVASPATAPVDSPVRVVLPVRLCSSAAHTRNANESAENTCGCLVTIVWVGPRHTEYASTHGTISG